MNKYWKKLSQQKSKNNQWIRNENVEWTEERDKSEKEVKEPRGFK